MFKKGFNGFLRWTIGIILLYSIISAISVNGGQTIDFMSSKYFVNMGIILIIICVILVAYVKKEKIINFMERILKTKNLLLYILFLGFILRVLWIVLVSTVPFSDFGMMYDSARAAQSGDFSSFHGYSYFARFAHDTIPVLYYSLFFNITKDPLFLIKLCNVFLSTLSIYAMYLLVKKLFGNKSALLGSLLLACFPPFIMYVSQTMTENLAMPFFIFSVYYFISFVKDNENYKDLVLCGIFLSLANMLRMVGTVFIVAYIMYILVYKGLLKGVKTAPIILVSFFIPMFIVSSVLLSTGVTETHLWNSKEPFWTHVLKGTNFQAKGHWNEEDARVASDNNYDTAKVKAASIRIIKDRLTHASPQQIFTLAIAKLGSEVGFSDFSSYEWTTTKTKDTTTVSFVKYFRDTILTITCFYYLFLLFWGSSYLLKTKALQEEVNFFLIVLGGFLLLYVLTEVQARYSFIIAWVFVIFAIGGIRKKAYETIYKI